MNLLITGGAGFIGSHFVLRHVEKHPSDTVVVLDKMTYAADKSFLDPVASKITFVEGDIVDEQCVTELVKAHDIDTIVNFAAESHNDNAIADASPFLQTNIMGTYTLLEVCRKHDVRLLQISTDEVYGDLEDDDPPYKVSDTLLPNMPYAATKASAEMLIIAWMNTHKVKACISRCTNNYGPHQHAEKFLPTVIRNALADKKIPVYGTGKNKRDWLYVTDHCDAIELLLQTDWVFWDDAVQAGHIFNISADDERENIETAKATLDLLGKPHDLIEFVDDRPGHDWRYAIDSSQIRKLGWAPKVSFEEGLRKTVEWYQHL